MMTFIAWAAILFNVGMAIWGWKEVRRYRKLAEQWLVLDFLLQQMAVQAFTNHQLPMWKAWTPIMGELNVEVKGTRRLPR